MLTKLNLMHTVSNISQNISWDTIISQEQNKPYFKKINSFINKQIQAGKIIHPPLKDIFNAFKLTSFQNTKVIILGQDPYHGPNQAHGLAFSVLENSDKLNNNNNNKLPPSLINIFKAIQTPPIQRSGNLTDWATQGVLLLNTTLTVEQSQPNSHAKIGWEKFTDQIISELNLHKDNLVFLLWGKHAQSKVNLIDKNKHRVLTSSHPSPLSAYRGFLDCQHFTKANQLLTSLGKQPIAW